MNVAPRITKMSSDSTISKEQKLVRAAQTYKTKQEKEQPWLAQHDDTKNDDLCDHAEDPINFFFWY